MSVSGGGEIRSRSIVALQRERRECHRRQGLGLASGLRPRRLMVCRSRGTNRCDDNLFMHDAVRFRSSGPAERSDPLQSHGPVACWRRDIVHDEIAIPAATHLTRRRPIPHSARMHFARAARGHHPPAARSGSARPRAASLASRGAGPAIMMALIFSRLARSSSSRLLSLSPSASRSTLTWRPDAPYSRSRPRWCLPPWKGAFATGSTAWPAFLALNDAG
jgi:hypothetical protein